MDMIVWPLIGGILIGLAASSLLLLNGRIFGISGILAGALSPKKGDMAWRYVALMGLIVAGALLAAIYPKALAVVADGPTWRYALAGLLVGYGTQLGSGCTSGHGVCGISRWSRRSLAATATFMAAGMMTVALLRAAGAL